MAGRKRRTWSDEDKRTICHQTSAPGVSIAQVARRYALNANQIFNWLKDARFAPSPDAADSSVFLPIEVCGEPTTSLLAPVLEPAKACPPDGSSQSRRHSHIEIMLSGGHRVMVEGSFDGTEVARLLKGLVF